jgi:MYXO-CTERM domain-containing protein
MSGPEKTAGDAARDVLAAEAFAVPSGDPTLRHQPIALPEDPSRIAEAHDVLAAEEFAMPAPRGPSESGGGTLARAGEAASPKRIAIAAALALMALILLRRRRRGPYRSAWEETTNIPTFLPKD